MIFHFVPGQWTSECNRERAGLRLQLDFALMVTRVGSRGRITLALHRSNSGVAIRRFASRLYRPTRPAPLPGERVVIRFYNSVKIDQPPCSTCNSPTLPSGEVLGPNWVTAVRYSSLYYCLCHAIWSWAMPLTLILQFVD